MSCYVSHLDDLLRDAGIEPTKPNRRRVDIILRRITGQERCNQTWFRIKALLADPGGREELAIKLRDGWKAEEAAE